MKKFYFGTLIVLSAMMFGSCSQNDDVVNGEGGLSDKEVYFSFAFGMPSSGTRAYADEATGSTDENKVNKVKVILFDDATDPVVTFVKDFDATDPEAGTPGYPMTSATAGTAFKVPGTSKNMLLVVNPGLKFPTVAIGNAYSTVNAALAATVADLTTTKGFEMANSDGKLLDISANLKETAPAAQSTPAKIYVDRAVAKVIVRETVTTGGVTGGATVTLSDFGWKLNVTNKSYFPTSTRVKTSADTSVFSDRNGLGSYRIDPNYSTQPTPITDAYNFLPATNAAWNASDASEYCLENTQDAANNKEGYTTQVLIKLRYTPVSVKNKDNGDVTVNAGSSWISLAGVAYTWETLTGWIEAELTARSKDASPSTYATPKYNATKAFLEDSNIGITVPALSTSGSTTDAENDVTSVMAVLDNVDTSSWPALSVGSFNYYKNAVNYYRVMIKHDEDKGNVNALGEFGVVRNNQYTLTVAKVLNPGDPTIVDPKPGDDDESDERYLSVQIAINPWTAWTQNVEL